MVHPRTGGERLGAPLTVRVSNGSSPHGRGTLAVVALCRVPRRFIPARAGNAPDPGGRCCPRAVHPRTGGERWASKL